MGLIKNVAALSAVAAAGVLVANRGKVVKAVKGMLASPKAPAKAKLGPAKSAGGKAKKEPHAKAPRAARRKPRRTQRAAAQP